MSFPAAQVPGTPAGASGPRREESDPVGCALRFGWLLAGVAIAASACWSLICSFCAQFMNPGESVDSLRTLEERGLFLYAVGPLIGSLLFTAGMGIATLIVRARRRRRGAPRRGRGGRT